MKLSILILAFIMIGADVGMFLTQTAITNIAASEGINEITVHQYAGSALSGYDMGNYTLANETTASGLLPSGQGEVVPNTGNFFTDLFSTMKNWFLQTTGLNYVIRIVTAVPNMITAMGFPPEVSFALGAIWHILTVLLIILGLFGR